ncbi:hypothetical protein SERLA73DRAFT_71145 [Serpula lacrymans var. lacrymans S7.3]|uniref:Uncharacterized protein n=2 Tax=Serpula lacrymans var. lacrymans TaxID=341189 RepID=F8PPB2_SERL3|nr:uncharacterized protein SERLADRAFT_435388 [Serpula lacrymans var. lacrymans S7.9]EGO01989.1 hypothetical protein SERLA73DRAFT_71145 [Serpula lacrymans var. lacrymans S7.3]EGO27612.1 hypothetical protein SERLADRAFT_435388 [Serpula lacrymans var. lacrymans S7.9]
MNQHLLTITIDLLLSIPPHLSSFSPLKLDISSTITTLVQFLAFFAIIQYLQTELVSDIVYLHRVYIPTALRRVGVRSGPQRPKKIPRSPQQATPRPPRPYRSPYPRHGRIGRTDH